MSIRLAITYSPPPLGDLQLVSEPSALDLGLQPRVKDPHFIANHYICTHTMDFMTPPTFDIINIQIWKVKMSLYLKGLGIYVYLATTKDSNVNNSKNIEANAKARLEIY